MSDIKTFCVAPWVHLNARVSGNLSPCCVSTLVSKESFNDYQSWWNGKEMSLLRQDLGTGIRSTSCNRCWQAEDMGKDSLRHNYNTLFKHYIDFNVIRKSLSDKKYDNIPTASTWEIDIGNLCNIKCIMCNPNLSDKIKDEVLENPNTFKNFPILSTQAHTHTQKTWIETDNGKEFLNKIKPSLRWLKIQGGEALSVKGIRNFLENIADNQITISITTNGTIMDQRLVEIFKRFKKIQVSLSLEAASTANDVIRYGSSWETILKTIETLKSIEQVELQFNHVVQATSVLFMPEVIKFAESINTHLAILPLQNHKYLSLSVCSPELLNKLLTQINDLSIENPKNKFIKTYMTNIILNTNFDKNLHQQFQEYVAALDSIRDKKLTPLIKELL